MTRPAVDWDRPDLHGLWTPRSISEFLGVPLDEYIYDTALDASDLTPVLAEEQHARDILAGEADDEIEDFHLEEAAFQLEEEDSPWGFDEDDVLQVAREIAAQDAAAGSSTFEELAAGGTPPPPVVTHKVDGTYVVEEGNHRIAFWQEQGHTEIPAWLNDEKARLRHEGPIGEKPVEGEGLADAL